MLATVLILALVFLYNTTIPQDMSLLLFRVDKEVPDQPSILLASICSTLACIARPEDSKQNWCSLFRTKPVSTLDTGSMVCDRLSTTRSPSSNGSLEFLAYIETRNRIIHYCVCCNATKVVIIVQGHQAIC